MIVSKKKPKTERTGFGARLRAIREAKGLTQEAVAEAAGMQYQSVARMERGDAENPTLRTLRSLASALGCSLAELVGE